MMQAEDSTLDWLAKAPLFSNISRGHLKGLAKSGTTTTYRPGQVIAQQGERGIGFYLVVDGELEVRKNGRRVALLRPGSFFGEMALFDDQPRSADIVAVGTARCLVFNRYEFWGECSKEPEVLRTLMQEMVRRLRSPTPGLSE